MNNIDFFGSPYNPRICINLFDRWRKDSGRDSVWWNSIEEYTKFLMLPASYGYAFAVGDGITVDAKLGVITEIYCDCRNPDVSDYICVETGAGFVNFQLTERNIETYRSTRVPGIVDLVSKAIKHIKEKEQT